jgi:hypothetical protein
MINEEEKLGVILIVWLVNCVLKCFKVRIVLILLMLFEECDLSFVLLLLNLMYQVLIIFVVTACFFSLWCTYVSDQTCNLRPHQFNFLDSGWAGNFFLIGGRKKINIKNSDIRCFRTTGRKQHDFPTVTFTLDEIWRHMGALFCNWKWIKWFRRLFSIIKKIFSFEK